MKISAKIRDKLLPIAKHTSWEQNPLINYKKLNSLFSV